jgi:Tfp pilus assembly protein PilE
MISHTTARRHSAHTAWRVARNEGFTLIELVAAIACIVVVLGALLPAVQMFREAENEDQAFNFLTQFEAVMQDFHRVNGQYPDTWLKALELGKAPADGAVSGFQLIPESLAPHELVMQAEPIPGVTGGKRLLLHLVPTVEGSSLQSAPIASADDARNRMFQRLINFTSQEIASLIYLLPPAEHAELFKTIVPFIEQSPASPEVMNALESLSVEGVFSLASFFEQGEAVAIEDAALRQRFASFVEGTRAILQIGAFNEQMHRGGVIVKNIVQPGAKLSEVLWSWGRLAALTSSFVTDDRGRTAGLTASQVERELLQLLEQAAAAERNGDEAQKTRRLAQYIALVEKVEGMLLTSLQADALIGIARSM